MDYRSTIIDPRCSSLSNRDVPSFIEPRPPLILNPFMRPKPQKGMNLLELFEEDSIDEEVPELVQVYLRLKPSNVQSNLYEIRSDQCLITSVDTATAGHGRRTQHNVCKMYKFSHIFGPDANQKDIFEHVVKGNLRKLPEGNSFTLLTYGASGSGKTYTLMGTVKAPGLVPRSLEYVFKVVEAAQTPVYRPGESRANKLSLAEQEHELQWVRHLRQVSAPLRDKYRRMSSRLGHDLTKSTIDLSTRTKHYVWVSFVEIYNEAIYDLLVTTERTAASKLRIREDPSGNVYVKGATQAFVRTGEEAYDVLVAGKHNLQVHATGVHAQSSRSHCIFTITMLTETEGGVRASFVRLCDLAGSERARRTRNTGARMVESRAINSSLHVLERCLHTLRRKQDLVPYRESKLTRLLGAGLSGTRGEAVSMVVTLNPAPEYAHETRHVLQLAAVARDIQVNNTIAESISTLDSTCSQDTTVTSSADVVRLRADNERLHYELVQAQALYNKLMADMEEQQQENAMCVKELVDEARDITEQFYKAQMRSLEERYEAEISELREEYEAQINKKAVVTEDGTPSRSLRKKIIHLTQQVAILEEELSAERLARARMEQEMQHLRACIEERDEKASDNSNNEDAIDVTDSEDESDEVDDLCNESLEPTFKKEDINRSRLIRQSSTLNNTHNTTCDMNKTEDTVKDDSLTDKDLTDLTDESKRDSTMTVDQTDETYERTDETYDVSNNDSCNDNSINCPATVKKADVKSDFKLSSEVGRGTYFVDSKVELKPNARETYFVNDSKISVNADEDQAASLKKMNDADDSGDTGINESLDDISTGEIKDKNASVSVEEPLKPIETQIDKIKKFAKTTISSDSSLTQFELLEMEANDFGKLEKAAHKYFDDDKTVAYISPRKLKDKKPYFDNINASSPKVDLLKDFSKNHNVLRSPSIVHDEIPENYKPTTINKILRESYSKNVDLPSGYDKSRILLRKHDSIDIFEEMESPCQKQELFKSVEKARQSIEKITLGNEKQNKEKSQSNEEIIKEKVEFEIVDNEKHNEEKSQCNEEIIQEKVETEKVDNEKQHEEKSQSNEEIIKEKVKIEIVDNEKQNKEKSQSNEEIIQKKVEIEIESESVKPDDVPSYDEKHPESNKSLTNCKFIPEKDLNTKPETLTEDKKLRKSSTKLNDSAEITNQESTSKTDESDEIKLEMCVPSKKVSFDTDVKNQESKSEIDTETTKPDTFKPEECVVIKTEFDIPATKEIDPKIKIKQERKSSISTGIVVMKEQNEIETEEPPTVTSVPNDLTNINQTSKDNTIDAFEDIYKDITAPRATDFELLVTDNTQEILESNNDKTGPTTTKDNKTDKVINNLSANIEENTAQAVKYNLRHRKEHSEIDNEILAENTAKCSRTVKKSLRLRRQKNKAEEDDKDTLKNIVNLQNEFSDVTLDVPAPVKDVKDIPSPDQSESENLPPLMGIQSCPSKSVTRSRRKLFTPRPEPLDESPSQVGDSNERVRVPRPSYHRTRTRRRLN